MASAAPTEFWCPTCARPVNDPLVCGDCSALLCRICGTPLESGRRTRLWLSTPLHPAGRIPWRRNNRWPAHDGYSAPRSCPVAGRVVRLRHFLSAVLAGPMAARLPTLARHHHHPPLPPAYYTTRSGSMPPRPAPSSSTAGGFPPATPPKRSWYCTMATVPFPTPCPNCNNSTPWA